MNTKKYKKFNLNMYYFLWAKNILRTCYQEGRYWLKKN